MIRKYRGDKKSIEAMSDDRGQTWKVKLFDAGHLTEYRRVTLAQVETLAAEHKMRLAQPERT